MSSPSMPPFKNMNGLTLEEFVKLLESQDHLDLKEQKVETICDVCSQVALQIFTTIHSEAKSTAICSPSCFRTYSQQCKEQERKLRLEEKLEKAVHKLSAEQIARIKARKGTMKREKKS